MRAAVVEVQDEAQVVLLRKARASTAIVDLASNLRMLSLPVSLQWLSLPVNPQTTLRVLQVLLGHLLQRSREA